jgi:nucleotide-binding universal stress UspA family protein
MEIRTILVGYDESAESEKAVETAFQYALVFKSEVLVVAVARPPEPSIAIEVHAVLDEAKEHFEENFKKIVERASELGVSVRTEVIVGHPAEQIIHRAESLAAGLIILGRKGHSRFERLILGSTTEKVIRFTHCPVLVVK